ncbi:hypothetical protein OG331_50805 [Streptomyces sp. NBC_01017]|nr:hypothetical protein OG331_01170 [Streptomyces sp. NBC_01017]WSV35218.1 hypothetical protein OG331_50805 [Streptomyces sp. NBC_01017]
MCEERADQGGVEVGEVEVGGLFAGLLARIAKQQTDGVAVGDDGVAACLALVGEPVGEEALDEGCR